jgi:hypothetical protein
MKGTVYFCVVMTVEYNVMVNRGITWYHRVFDITDEVSYKPITGFASVSVCGREGENVRLSGCLGLNQEQLVT